MNKLGLDSIAQGKIKIDVLDEGTNVAIRFVGDIDMEDPSIILDPLFEKIHTGMVIKKLHEITADFRQLTFLNSSGIKALAKWIMKLVTLPADQKYAIKIVHNKSITWQVTSLPTLTYLVPGGVKIE
jgi:hypothetical protein